MAEGGRGLEWAQDALKPTIVPGPVVAFPPMTHLLALARQRRVNLLIVGCGDVGMRVLQLVGRRWNVTVLTSSPGRRDALRAAGARPLVGDLDDPSTLGRLGGLCDLVLHLAPPPGHGREDPRTAHLLRALARAGRVRRLVYGSTTGVYGDCGGAWIDETRAVAPATERAWRRVDAESRVRHFGRLMSAAATVLRIPGIYALDREGGDPRDRLRRGLPVLQAADDVYTNHIHADDLARACVAALLRGGPQRVIHVCDDGTLAMADHYDRVADLSGLPRSPRLSREEAQRVLSPMMMSFLSESRRLRNERLRRELRVRLRFATVEDALGAAAAAATPLSGASGSSSGPRSAASGSTAGHLAADRA
jgi:nucleoside-diphosphate-sugar epimerase